MYSRSPVCGEPQGLAQSIFSQLEKTVVLWCVLVLMGDIQKLRRTNRKAIKFFCRSVNSRSHISKIQQTSWSSQKNKTNLSHFNTRSEHIMTNILRAEKMNIVCTAYENFSPEWHSNEKHSNSYTTCHPPEAKKRFAKGEALRLLRTYSSKQKFVQNTFGRGCFEQRSNPKNLINNTP